MGKFRKLGLFVCLVALTYALIRASMAVGTPLSSAQPLATKTGVPPPEWTATSTPVGEDYMPVVLRHGNTPTPTATLDPRITPTVGPTKTGIPNPNQTATSTPVNEDYMPVVLRHRETPTPTATRDPRITPTEAPKNTPAAAKTSLTI